MKTPRVGRTLDALDWRIGMEEAFRAIRLLPKRTVKGSIEPGPEGRLCKLHQGVRTFECDLCRNPYRDRIGKTVSLALFEYPYHRPSDRPLISFETEKQWEIHEKAERQGKPDPLTNKNIAYLAKKVAEGEEQERVFEAKLRDPHTTENEKACLLLQQRERFERAGYARHRSRFRVTDSDVLVYWCKAQINDWLPINRSQVRSVATFAKTQVDDRSEPVSEFVIRLGLKAGVLVRRSAEQLLYQTAFGHSFQKSTPKDFVKELRFDKYVFKHLARFRPAPGMTEGNIGDAAPARGASRTRYCFDLLQEMCWSQFRRAIEAGHSNLEIIRRIVAYRAEGHGALLEIQDYRPNIYLGKPKEKCDHGMLNSHYCSMCCVYEIRSFVSDSPRSWKTLERLACVQHGFTCPYLMCKEHFKKRGGRRIAPDAKPCMFKDSERILEPLEGIEPCPKCSFGHLASFEEMEHWERIATTRLDECLLPLTYDIAPYIPLVRNLGNSCLPELLTVQEAAELNVRWQEKELSRRDDGSKFQQKKLREGLRHDVMPWEEVGTWLARFYPEHGRLGSADNITATRLSGRLYDYQVLRLTYEDIGKKEGKKKSTISSDIARFYAKVAQAKALRIEASAMAPTTDVVLPDSAIPWSVPEGELPCFQ